MNGLSFKTSTAILALLSTLLLSPVARANNNPQSHAQAGCMSCHQGGPDKIAEKHQDNQTHKNKAKA